MNRKEAIQHIFGLEASVANEFYISAAEDEEGQERVTAALVALGVTQAEIDAAWDDEGDDE